MLQSRRSGEPFRAFRISGESEEMSRFHQSLELLKRKHHHGLLAVSRDDHRHPSRQT
jgi:hypothetical protein